MTSSVQNHIQTRSVQIYRPTGHSCKVRSSKKQAAIGPPTTWPQLLPSTYFLQLPLASIKIYHPKEGRPIHIFTTSLPGGPLRYGPAGQGTGATKKRVPSCSWRKVCSASPGESSDTRSRRGINIRSSSCFDKGR